MQSTSRTNCHLRLVYGPHEPPKTIAEFRVFGLPAPQGSKRHVGRGIMVESSQKVRPWRNDVIAASQLSYKGEPLRFPVAIELTFYFPRPKSHFRTGKYAGILKANAPTWTTSNLDGDLDKLCRATLDGLSHKSGGMILIDDSICARLTAEKRYVINTAPGCLVRVVELA